MAATVVLKVLAIPNKVSPGLIKYLTEPGGHDMLTVCHLLGLVLDCYNVFI
jgi:hypothetical protein